MGGGEDHVDDVESTELFLGGDLGGIDGGRRFADVDDFADFLHVSNGDVDGGCCVDLYAGLLERVEALLLDVELILAGGQAGELAASDEIGLAVPGGLRWGLQRDTGGGDGDSVLVENDDRGGGGILGAAEQ